MKANLLKIIILAIAIIGQSCNSNNDKTNSADTEISDTMTMPPLSDRNPQDIAQTETDPGKSPSMFMEQAAIGGMMEIEAANIAKEKASDIKVKDFATLMIKDHTKAANELKAIAKDKKVDLPATLPKKEQSHLDEMKKLSGRDFDKHYMDMMVNDHKKTVDLFKSASSNTDSALNTFAAKTLKIIELHYKTAQDINGVLKTK